MKNLYEVLNESLINDRIKEFFTKVTKKLFKEAPVVKNESCLFIDISELYELSIVMYGDADKEYKTIEKDINDLLGSIVQYVTNNYSDKLSDYENKNTTKGVRIFKFKDIDETEITSIYKNCANEFVKSAKKILKTFSKAENETWAGNIIGKTVEYHTSLDGKSNKYYSYATLGLTKADWIDKNYNNE